MVNRLYVSPMKSINPLAVNCNNMILFKAQMAFSDDLKKWRGKRYHKQVSDALGVRIWTYRNWELGRRKPKDLAMQELLRRMKENPE